jgi:hypothetical protein
MRQRMTAWCVAAMLVLWTGIADAADPSYAFAFAQANYLATPGGTVDVTVYLQETVGSGTSVLDANGVGMYGAGVSLSFSSSASTPAKVVTTAGIVGNAAFNDANFEMTAVTSTTATLSEVTDFLSFVHANNPTPGQTKYLMPIGTFTFTAGTTRGEVTTISTGSNPGGDVNVTGGDFVALDSTIANASATITVAAPEPSSIVILVTALFGTLAYFWKKRRRIG